MQPRPRQTVREREGRRDDGPNSYGVKVYLVMLPNNVARPGEPNVKIIAYKLTRAAAQKIVDRVPGAYIEKGLADKL